MIPDFYYAYIWMSIFSSIDCDIVLQNYWIIFLQSLLELMHTCTCVCTRARHHLIMIRGAYAYCRNVLYWMMIWPKFIKFIMHGLYRYNIDLCDWILENRSKLHIYKSKKYWHSEMGPTVMHLCSKYHKK